MYRQLDKTGRRTPRRVPAVRRVTSSRCALPRGSRSTRSVLHNFRQRVLDSDSVGYVLWAVGFVLNIFLQVGLLLTIFVQGIRYHGIIRASRYHLVQATRYHLLTMMMMMMMMTMMMMVAAAAAAVPAVTLITRMRYPSRETVLIAMRKHTH